MECNHKGCEKKIPNHKWSKIKNTKWFFQKDGTVWCPDHIPVWVSKWRKSMGKRR